jgi:hypothetical protein
VNGPIHPGPVIHLWDHFVLDFETEGGFAYLSIYAIALSPSIGPANIALLAYDLGDGRRDMVIGDDVSAARRMQERLRSMRYARSSLDVEPGAARFVRSADQHHFRWRIDWESHTAVATWSELRTPFQLLTPAPQLVADEDITTVFVEAGHAKLEVDGASIEADALPDEYWLSKVGRPLLACHAALAEARVRARTPAQ